jgi:hypothetical protein
LAATTILLQERAEALERLRDTLVNLDGAAVERVAAIHERGRAGREQIGQEYMTAQLLAVVAEVLADQQARIEELEAIEARR